MAERLEYTDEIGDAICGMIAKRISVAKICEQQHMPGMTTFFKWLRENEEFAKNYARAREAQAEILADETLEIADDENLDANDKRVRIDTRKWLAGKHAPKRYSDKITQEITGADGGPIKTTVDEDELRGAVKDVMDSFD